MADGTAASTSKIRIKIGQVEVEYEGTHEFLKQDLPALLSTVIELKQKAGDDETETTPGDASPAPGKKQRTGGSTTGTVGAIAAKLKVGSGPDLIIAAAAKLTLGDGIETFSRKQILTSMKTASAYYRKTYRNNMAAYLNTLQKNQRITESATDSFALTAAEKKKLESQLA